MRFTHQHLTALRIAMATVATTVEIRPQLHGVYFDFPRRRMVASDGARMFIAELPETYDEDEQVMEPRILKVVGPDGKQLRKLPARWHTVDLDVDGLVLRESGIGSVQLQPITEKYFDVDRVIVPYLKAVDKPGEDANRIGLNPCLLFGWAHEKFTKLSVTCLREAYQAMLVTFQALTIPHIGIVLGLNKEGPYRDPREVAGDLISY